MAATLIRLKLRLMANSFSRSVWQILGTIFVLLYGLGMATMFFVLQLRFGRGEEPLQNLLNISVGLGTVAMLFWIAVPLFVAGGDNLMDPRRFVTYAVPRNSLIVGLVASALISVGAIITLFWLIGQVALWRAEPGTLVTALLTLPLLLLTFSLVSQAITTAMSAWFGGRRSRDVLAIIGVLLAISVWPLMTLIQDAFNTLEEAMPVIVEVLSFTPLAAGVALPASVAEGDWVGFLLRAVILLVTMAACLLVIRVALVTITERPKAPAAAKAVQQGKLGFFGLFPAAPWGAVAARSMTYWFKDPRYGASLVMVPALTVVAVVMASQSQMHWMLYALGPFFAWALGYGISADISYDSTAFAHHVTAGVRGIDDRMGRVAALMSFALPLTMLAAVVPPLLVGTWQAMLLTAGISLGALLVAVGFSAFISARLIYPVPKPGESPFATPQGSAGRAFILQMASWLTLLLFMAPELVLWAIWLATGAVWVIPVLLTITLVKGALMLWWGIRLGAKVYDRSQPELYQQVRSYA